MHIKSRQTYFFDKRIIISCCGLIIFFGFYILYKFLNLFSTTDFNANESISVPFSTSKTPIVELTRVNKKTYRSNNFSFEYPDNVSVLTVFEKEKDLLQIEFTNLEHKTTLIVARSTANVVDVSKIVNIQEQTINGIVWKNLQPQGNCYSGECEIPYFMLKTTKGNYNYVFKVGYTYIEPDLNTILSTFKFN